MTIRERLLRRALARLPPSRAQWGRALLAELDSLPHDQRGAWAGGGLLVVARALTAAVARSAAYGAAALAAIAAIVLTDRSSSDDANQVTLAVLIAGSVALGAWRPSLARLSGLLLGSAVAAARGAYALLGAPITGPGAPHGWGIAVLLVLNVPALLGALGGARLRDRSG